MNYIEILKKPLKKVSLLVSLTLLISLVNISIFSVGASAASIPGVTVSIDSYTPSNPKVGDAITFSGTIHPQDFEISIPSKEIVLVLDSSGSMADNSKLTKLKVAAKNFITKMSTVQNLKIAVIDFDTQATIRSTLISSSSTSTLNSVIDNLTAGGGTNTGEGLRQAAYLLSSSADTKASKTVVFMSDGEPTYYNYNMSNNQYYTDITKSSIPSNIARGGNGSTDSQSQCINYAIAIGKIIKDRGYNAFTISYGLNSAGNANMQKIHNSMSSVNGNFFASDTNSIDSVFNSIADTIKDNYPINNVEFNFNPGTDTNIESIDGNTISLDPINYKISSQTSTTIKYSASSIPFTIKVKSNVVGKNIPVFTNSTVTFSWQGNTITAKVPVQYINIYNAGGIPNINAKLEAVSPNPASSSDEITVKYNITTDPFKYTVISSGGSIDEAEVLVDLSQDMKNNQRFSEVQNGLVNQIINDSNLSNMKLGVIGYNDYVYVGTRSNYTDPKSCIMQQTDENLNGIDKTRFLPLYNLNDGNTKDGYRQFYQNGYLYNKISNNSNRKFGTALKVADKILTDYGNASAKKAIVIITSGDLNYTDDQINSIKNKGYKIIILDISNSSSTKINDTFVKLCGSESSVNGNYYKGTLNDGVNYNSVDDDMKKVSGSLKAGIIQSSSLSISNAVLNIDLGENFDAVEGAGLNGSGKTRTVTIPQINYTYNQSTGLWEQSNPIEVTFKVKAESGKYGDLGFGTYTNSENVVSTKSSTISYTNFDGDPIEKVIETPVITVKQAEIININHGLYNGIVNNEPQIDSLDGSRSFSKGTTITLAALVDGITNNNSIGIKFDDSLNNTNIDASKIQVFALENNNPVDLKYNGEIKNNIYTFTPTDISNGEKILIRYTETLPVNAEKGTEYTNDILVNGEETNNPATVKIGDALPDLF